MIGSYESKGGVKYEEYFKAYLVCKALFFPFCCAAPCLCVVRIPRWPFDSGELIAIIRACLCPLLVTFYIKCRGPNHSIFIGWLFQAKSMLFLKNCNKCNVQDSCRIWVISSHETFATVYVCYFVKATKVDTDDERNRYQELLQFTCVLENLPLKDLLVECCQCASKVSDFLNPDRRKTRHSAASNKKWLI